MNKQLKKTLLIGLGAVLLFLGLSYAFVPEVLDGKIVNQGDIQHYVGMSHEMSQWDAAHPDDPTYWTGSMFSGMPTAPITVVGGGDVTKPLYDALLLGYRPATYLFVALLGGFLLMLALGVDWLLAIIGGIAIGFCSYNFQIIQAGHNTKMQAIAFMPWVLAGLLWTYRVALGRKDGKLPGQEAPSLRRLSWWARTAMAAALFALALDFEIKANHVQVTYYLALMIALYAITMVVWVAWKRRAQWREFLVASGLLLLLGLLGIGANANKLMPISDYQPISMRGGSELQAAGGNESNAQKGTLSLQYATDWSYGWNELPNLMIANWNGGGNGARVDLSDSKGKAAMKEDITADYVAYALQAGYPIGEAQQLIRQQYGYDIDQEAAYRARQLMYWGPQPFTAGPMYIGCITVFLFILGVCLYDGKEKWWLLAVAVLAALLSVGYSSDGERFYDIQKLAFSALPLYGKFRTVSMILVLMQVALPMLGILALDRVLKQAAPDRKRLLRGLGISFGVVAAGILLALVWPREYVGAADASYLSDTAIAGMAADRKALMQGDALTALALVTATLALLLWATLSKERPGWLSRNRRTVAGAGIGILVLAHLFTVGHRYLNEEHFVTPGDFKRVYNEREVDREIKKRDPGKTARVLDLTGSPFNSAIASYHHRCIGGYSPAKLQRYQELIETFLTDEITIANQYAGLYDWVSIFYNMPVTNLLNGRYLITKDGELVENPCAYGPAWFVDGTLPVESPDEELHSIGQPEAIYLRETAVLGPDFRDAAPRSLPGSERDTVELLSYAPNRMQYRYHADTERILVFSEIYHKDWKATVDGKPLPLFRTDWVLRGAVVPAGDHEIVMRFEPAVYAKGQRISLTCSLTLLLVLLIAAGGSIWLCRKRQQS